MSQHGIRLGLVGCGGIARAYVAAAAAQAGFHFSALCDTRIAAAEDLARECGAEVSTRCEDMPPVDGVLVCTPPRSHAAVARHFLAAGVPVLCEKPFTLHLAEAIELVRTARRTHTRVTMASKFRFVSDVLEAKELFAAGAIGTALLFENAFASKVDMAGRWNADPRLAGGGVLIDNGSHALDLTRWFLGPLAEVHAVEGRRTQGLAVEETVRLTARSRAGVLCGIDLSWSLDRGSDTYLRLSGSDGTICVGWHTSRWRHGSGAWTSFGSGYDKLAALREQLAQFARAGLGESADLVTPLEAVASVAAVEAGYASLRTGRWTPVRDLEDASRPGELGAAAELT